jgi:hypothetical protein
MGDATREQINARIGSLVFTQRKIAGPFCETPARHFDVASDTDVLR